MISEDLNSLDFHLKRHLNILGLKKREDEQETKNMTSNMSEVYNVVNSNSASVMTYLQQEVGATNSLSSSKVQKYKHFLDEADQVSFFRKIYFK